MRLAALLALIVGIVLQATQVRPLRVENLSQATRSEITPFEEREEPDDEFEVRLTPDEVKAASGGGSFTRKERTVPRHASRRWGRPKVVLQRHGRWAGFQDPRINRGPELRREDESSLRGGDFEVESAINFALREHPIRNDVVLRLR
jgi:hypothetical protein